MLRYAELGGVIGHAAKDLVRTDLRKRDELVLIDLARVMVGILFVLFLQLR
jgi:hypothetical protein